MLGVDPDWILCGNGSDDMLTIVTRAFVGEAQSLRLPYPSYILYQTLAQLQGAAGEEVRFEHDWTLWRQTFAGRAADLRLAFLPNPNSPSGTILPPERVLELAERLPCPLLVDEAYADFAEQNCLDLVRRVGQDHRLAVAEQVVCFGRAAVWLFGGAAARDRAVDQGEGFVQLRRACRSPGPRPPSTTRPGSRRPRPRSWPRGRG